MRPSGPGGNVVVAHSVGVTEAILPLYGGLSDVAVCANDHILGLIKGMEREMR